MRRMLILVALLTLTPTVSNADFEDFQGNGFLAGTSTYRETRSSNGEAVCQLRYCVPEDGNHWWGYSSNVYMNDTRVIRARSLSPGYGVAGFYTPFNEGTTGSGVWLTLYLPTGVNIQFEIEIEQIGSSHTYFSGVDHPMAWGWPDGTDYTLEDDLCDYSQAAVQQAVSAALAYSGDYLPGPYAVVEKFQAWIANNITLVAHAGFVQRASVTASSRTGDCDDASILLVAMLRSINIPSRVMLCASFSGSTGIPGYNFSANGMHANADYWDGITWNATDAGRSTVYVTPFRFSWGASDNYLYVFPAEDARYHTTLLSAAITTSAVTTSGNYARTGTRNPFVNPVVWSGAEIAGGIQGAPQMSPPHDPDEPTLTDVVILNGGRPASGGSTVGLRAWPNPFRTEVHFSLPAAGMGTIEVYDVRGRKIATIESAVDGTASWLPIGTPPGVYFAHTGEGATTATVKLQLLR